MHSCPFAATRKCVFIERFVLEGGFHATVGVHGEGGGREGPREPERVKVPSDIDFRPDKTRHRWTVEARISPARRERRPTATFPHIHEIQFK